MASIKMPSAGETFFQFVQGIPEERTDLSFFPTYAHLLTAASTLGKAIGGFDDTGDFKKKQPLPIDLGVFRNNGLYQTLLILAISETGSEKISQDEEALCRTIEGLACAGFAEMNQRYDKCGHAQYWLAEWESIVTTTTEVTLPPETDPL